MAVRDHCNGLHPKPILFLLAISVFLSACGGGQSDVSTDEVSSAQVQTSVPIASMPLPAPNDVTTTDIAAVPSSGSNEQPLQDGIGNSVPQHSISGGVAPANTVTIPSLQLSDNTQTSLPNSLASAQTQLGESVSPQDSRPVEGEAAQPSRSENAASADNVAQLTPTGSVNGASQRPAAGSVGQSIQADSANSLLPQLVTSGEGAGMSLADGGAPSQAGNGNLAAASGPFEVTEQPASSIEQNDTAPSPSINPQTGIDTTGRPIAGDRPQSGQLASTEPADVLQGDRADDPASVDSAVAPVADAVAPVVPVSNPVAPAIVDVVPANINETFSENEEEEGADSVLSFGCVGNLAWLDSNADGIRTSDEKGLKIDLIELVSLGGQVVDVVATNSGYYQLCAAPGPYLIRFEIPAGYVVTVQDAGRSDTADSDANQAGVIEAVVVVAKNKTKYDIGLVPLPGAASVDTPLASEIAQDEENVEPVVPVQPVAEQQQPVEQVFQVVNNTVANGRGVTNVRWGFWTETRNAFESPLGPVDEGVETTFENYTFAHVKALSLRRVEGDTRDKQYVINVLNKARATNTVLDLKLGSAGEYGWNFDTERGNFNLRKWKDALSNFSASADRAGHAAISAALRDGTIRYIFLIDEPNHKRWSPQWDGTTVAGAPGNPNHVSNQDLDEMAAHVKSIFGNDTQTIVRASATNLISGARGGAYVFRHLTHSYLTVASKKWTAGARKGPNKGLEWWLTLKNNHTDNTTNFTAYEAANLKPSIMIQAGFESTGNPWTGQRNFKSRWWSGNVRYPFRGVKSYTKTAPLEMDYWIKSLLSPRDPTTGALSDSGVRWFNEFVIFRADRLPTDSGKLPFSTYPHYSSFLDRLKTDLQNNDLNPLVGLPVGWTGD